MLRLQHILIHRELDIPLADIATIIDAPNFNRLEALERHRERLGATVERYARMLNTFDRTIAKLKGNCAMKDADLFTGVVSPEKQAKYEEWLIDRYGQDMEDYIQSSRTRTAQMSKEDWAKIMTEADEILEPIVEGFKRQLPPQARSLSPALERHRKWISRAWGREATLEAYAGLADVYQHRDFVARFDKVGEGFTEYLTTAMRSCGLPL